MHITGGILLCGMGDLPQRNIYNLGEKIRMIRDNRNRIARVI